MDLRDLDSAKAAEQGAEMTLRHPITAEPLTEEDGTIWTITLSGLDGMRARRAQADATQRVIGSGRSVRVQADAEASMIAVLSACTLKWSVMVVDGKRLDCTEQNASLVYSRFPWVREQANQFVSDRANFLRA